MAALAVACARHVGPYVVLPLAKRSECRSTQGAETVLGEIRSRINELGVDDGREVQVGSNRPSGHADIPDQLALADPGAHGEATGKARQVGVERRVLGGMADFYGQPVLEISALMIDLHRRLSQKSAPPRAPRNQCHRESRLPIHGRSSAAARMAMKCVSPASAAPRAASPRPPAFLVEPARGFVVWRKPPKGLLPPPSRQKRTADT